MAPDVLVEVARLLEEQAAVYRELLALAERKEDILRLADVEALEQVVKVEQGLVLRCGELEKRRYAAQKALAAAWQVPVEDLTLSVIAERGEGPAAVRCRIAGEELAAVVGELQEQNERCAEILSGAISLVKRTLANTVAGVHLVDRLV